MSFVMEMQLPSTQVEQQEQQATSSLLMDFLKEQLLQLQHLLQQVVQLVTAPQ